MTDPHKLRIKIGDAEFEATGSEEVVKAQFEQFLAALSAAGTQAHIPPKSDQNPGNDELQGGAGEGIADDLMERAFLMSKDGGVSLKYLPKGEQREADALLLLIYGYRALKGEENVLGTQLTKAARVSGLSLDRVDRAISKHDALLLKGGARKGMKYSLNNQGVTRAEEILKKMLS